MRYKMERVPGAGVYYTVRDTVFGRLVIEAESCTYASQLETALNGRPGVVAGEVREVAASILAAQRRNDAEYDRCNADYRRESLSDLMSDIGGDA